MSHVQIAVLIGVGAAVTLVLTPLVRTLSVRAGLVDRPGGRKVHTSEISRLGGIAIFGGFMSAVAAAWAATRFLGWGGSASPSGVSMPMVMAGIAIMFLVGVLDDVVTLRPAPKLLGQVVAAGVVIASGLRIDFVGNPFGGGLIVLGLMSVPITLVYIVGFTNVINLIDGLDGLAAGVSAIAASTLMVLALQANRIEAVVLAAALIGSCIGFLRYNFNPASIFMGDSGAMFLGFTLAIISMLGVMKSVAAIALAVPLIIIGVPIFDTASAIIRRVRHQRPIQEADKGHIHHRLLGRGFDQRQTVLIIYVWSAALSIGAYAMRYAPILIKVLSFGVLAGLSVFMAYWLGLFEAAHYHGEEHPPEGEKGMERAPVKGSDEGLA